MSSKERSTDPGLSPSQRKTLRSREAEEAIAEYGDHQTALHSNMERLRAERLNRETEAGPVLYPAEGISDDTPIERVQFSTRIRNALTGAGVTTIGEIRAASDATLLSLQDLGPGSLSYLREKLGLKAKPK
jgi:DNA-directed RNA polymerase alpha subunit